MINGACEAIVSGFASLLHLCFTSGRTSRSPREAELPAALQPGPGPGRSCSPLRRSCVCGPPSLWVPPHPLSSGAPAELASRRTRTPLVPLLLLPVSAPHPASVGERGCQRSLELRLPVLSCRSLCARFSVPYVLCVYALGVERRHGTESALVTPVGLPSTAELLVVGVEFEPGAPGTALYPTASRQKSRGSSRKKGRYSKSLLVPTSSVAGKLVVIAERLVLLSTAP